MLKKLPLAALIAIVSLLSVGIGLRADNAPSTPAAGSTTAPAPEAPAVCPDYRAASMLYLDEPMLSVCSCQQLDLLRNEILARHGKSFDRVDLRQYFAGQPWYKPDPRNPRGDENFSAFERWNLDLLARYLEMSGCRPGQAGGTCPTWPLPRLTVLDDRDLAACSCRDLELLRQEIGARHGKIFDRPDLKSYFESKIWYTADGTNPTGERGQNELERRNSAVIIAHEQGRGCMFTQKPEGPPCPVWPIPQNRLLASEELKNCSCRDLEILRHEIFARRGKNFSEPELRAYFFAQPWYKPDPNNPTGMKGMNQNEIENNLRLQEYARIRECVNK